MLFPLTRKDSEHHEFTPLLPEQISGDEISAIVHHPAAAARE
jgi:hypothetical protein